MMSIYEIALRLVACMVSVVGGIVLLWLALEWGWDCLWDALEALRDRARRARTLTEYQQLANSRYGRRVRQ